MDVRVLTVPGVLGVFVRMEWAYFSIRQIAAATTILFFLVSPARHNILNFRMLLSKLDTLSSLSWVSL